MKMIVFGPACHKEVGQTLTPPRASAAVAGRSLLQRWRTRVSQETPQWLPPREPRASPGPRDWHFPGFLAGQEKYQVFPWFLLGLLPGFLPGLLPGFFPGSKSQVLLVFIGHQCISLGF